MAVRRVMHELKKFVVPWDSNGVGLALDPHLDGRNNDVNKLTGMIVGPEDTPYFGGFFQFSVNIPPNYPGQPPVMKITTTDSGRVRFNPNLYSQGKVCMDILNNHASNEWSPVMGLETILLSTQSLMKADPYHNEPGFEDCGAKISPDGKTVGNPAAECQPYMMKILHETLRHAVCDQLERPENHPQGIPAMWYRPAVARFMKDVDKHIATCRKYSGQWDGRAFAIVRFEGKGNEAAGAFDFASILSRLEVLKSRFAALGVTAEGDSTGDSSAAAASASPAAPVAAAGNDVPTSRVPDTRATPPQPPADKPVGVRSSVAGSSTSAQAAPAVQPAPPVASQDAGGDSVFKGPINVEIEDEVSAAVAEMLEDDSLREPYEVLLAAITFALMEDPIFEPIAVALPPRASQLVRSLGFESKGGEWTLNTGKANRDALEATQALLSAALE